MGLVAISFAEIDAWARLSGRDPDPIEVRALRHVDHVLRVVAHESPADSEKAIEAWLTSQL